MVVQHEVRYEYSTCLWTRPDSPRQGPADAALLFLHSALLPLRVWVCECVGTEFIHSELMA